MDEATKRYRRRMKQQRGESELLGLGRKLKRRQTFPNVQCNYRDKETKVRCDKTATLTNVAFKTRFGISTGAFCEDCLKNVKLVRQG